MIALRLSPRSANSFGRKSTRRQWPRVLRGARRRPSLRPLTVRLRTCLLLKGEQAIFPATARRRRRASPLGEFRPCGSRARHRRAGALLPGLAAAGRNPSPGLAAALRPRPPRVSKPPWLSPPPVRLFLLLHDPLRSLARCLVSICAMACPPPRCRLRNRVRPARRPLPLNPHAPPPSPLLLLSRPVMKLPPPTGHRTRRRLPTG